MRHLLRRRCSDQTKLITASVRGVSAVADANLEYRHAAVHVVVARVIEVDRHAGGRLPGRASWIMSPVNWLSHPQRTATVKRFRKASVAFTVTCVRCSTARRTASVRVTSTRSPTLSPAMTWASVVSSQAARVRDTSWSRERHHALCRGPSP